LWKAVKKTSKNFAVTVDRYEGSPLYSPHNEGGDAASGRLVRPLSWLIEFGGYVEFGWLAALAG